MRSATPKQFLLLAGRPLLMHSVDAFARACPGIRLIVALPEAQFQEWHRLCEQFTFTREHLLSAGGETRFHSVRNALALAGDEGLIAIHDGARPLVSVPLIRRLFEFAAAHGNCIPVVPVGESLRNAGKSISRAVNRGDYRLVQTPQVFPAETIRQAYRQEYRPSFTDDATVVEYAGGIIHLADGDPANLKVTQPHDLAVAEALLPFQS